MGVLIRDCIADFFETLPMATYLTIWYFEVMTPHLKFLISTLNCSGILEFRI